jgi:hypothetical protein
LGGLLGAAGFGPVRIFPGAMDYSVIESAAN